MVSGCIFSEFFSVFSLQTFRKVSKLTEKIGHFQNFKNFELPGKEASFICCKLCSSSLINVYGAVTLKTAQAFTFQKDSMVRSTSESSTEVLANESFRFCFSLLKPLPRQSNQVIKRIALLYYL